MVLYCSTVLFVVTGIFETNDVASAVERLEVMSCRNEVGISDGV